MFSYLRIFLILSLMFVVAAAVAAGVIFGNAAKDDLIDMVRRNVSTGAKGYVNDIWKNYREPLTRLTAADAAQARNDPQVIQFAQETMRFFQHRPYARVNIYNAHGLLLMTSNPSGGLLVESQMSPDGGFVTRTLTQTQLASNLVEHYPFKDGSFGTVVQTVTPITTDRGNPDGAVEIIYDVTAPWQQLVDFRYYGTGAVIGTFFLFLLLLLLASRQTEAIITKQHEANLELAATAAAAQAENRNKSQFLANVSHELRTPLNAIIGFSDIIKNEVMPAVQEKKYHDYVHDINTSGLHLLSLINDILDYSKAEAGKLELEVSEVNATKMIQNCIRLLEPRTQSGHVKMIEKLPKDAVIMRTDGKKLKQIMLNLLSNAVKFTPAYGTVQVSVWRNVAEDSYSFEVRDSGIGIAPKDISLAMSPFGQVDNTLSRKYEGTGLGLPLTKKFIELMGGKFNIQSKVGVGTTITFTMPREVQEREGLILKQIA